MMKRVPAHLEDAFARFWKVFPKRVQPLRRTAEDAFTRAVEKGADAEFLVRAAGLFAAQIRADDVPRKFFPLAATWLHQERFADYAEPDEPPKLATAEEVQDPMHVRLVSAGIEPAAIAAWFSKTLISADPDAGTVTVSAVSKFLLSQIRERYDVRLRAAFGVDEVTYRWAGGDHGLA